MIEVLALIAGSWPIAAMVVGVTVAVVVRRCFRQVLDNSRAAQIDRAQGNQSVVVAARRPHLDD